MYVTSLDEIETVLRECSEYLPEDDTYIVERVRVLINAISIERIIEQTGRIPCTNYSMYPPDSEEYKKWKEMSRNG